MKFKIPLDVPKKMHKTYEKNFNLATHGTRNLMLFPGDQKIEHLNEDFFGKGIPLENNDPEHLFKIASKAKIGVFATQLGMIARYGMDYPKIPYLVKINSKTNLQKKEFGDPISTSLCDFEDVLNLKMNANLQIVGIGYTIYLGSEYESEMLAEAGRLIQDAHRNGMITVIWMYPRGKSVKDEHDPNLIAGATGVACCLGSDFVKVIPPKSTTKQSSAKLLKQATGSAGRTGVICSGESAKDPKKFLQNLYDQIHIGGARGNATGRNVHQKPLDEAIRFANAIFAITVQGKSVNEAWKIYKS